MVQIDLSRDSLLDAYATRKLKKDYMVEGEKSPQEAFARAAKAFADDDAHAQRLYDYASKHWFMFATPVLSNGGTKRGLPISCFLSYVPDSREGINDHNVENSWLSSSGGGLGASWSSLRTSGVKTSSGSQSTGMIPFLKATEGYIMAFKQGVTRRAAYAAYLDVSHPEILDFINMRNPTGGDPARKCLHLHHAVNVTDAFMQAVIDNTEWELRDPHTKVVMKVLPARSLWADILKARTETGEPYIHFIDTSNRALPQEQKNLNLLINNSNLCSEIMLPTDENRTAVCCLSSVNLEKWEEWKDTTMVEDLVRMLDNVLDVFIEAECLKPKAREDIRRAIYSATRERSIGLGAMGFHSLLQSKGIPFESEEAAELNRHIFSTIRARAELTTEELGVIKGSCPDFIEGGGKGARRNMHLLAIAPNASSSILCGNTSPSIEPLSANRFSQKTQGGTHVYKNKYLDKLLQTKGVDTESVWRSISAKNGSVQHLDCLTDHEKAVFRTAAEINQMWVILHAADRQKYIDQGQSVNLFFPAPIDAKYLNIVHIEAWKRGLKALYYLRTPVANRAENVGEQIERQHIKTSTELTNGYTIECVGCEG